MNRLHFYLFLISPFLFAQNNITERLEKLNPNGFSGFVLYDVEMDSILVDYHGNKNFIPASNTKIFTLYESKNLPEQLPYLEIKESKDTLYIKPNGNPAFCRPDCSKDPAFSYLKNTSKTIVIDSTQNIPFYEAGWSWEDFEYDFQAEKHMATIYGNLIPLDASHLAFKNDVFTLIDSTLNGRYLHQNIFYRKKGKSKVEKVPFIQTYQTYAQLLSLELQKPVGFHTFPMNSTLEIKNITIPKDSLLIEMMFDSDNFIAEQIGVMLNYYSNIKYSTYYNLPDDQKKLYDYSGLSRYNKVTPMELIQVLKQIQKENTNYLDFFPSNGKGTLKRLFPKHKPFIYAKSGSMGGVYNLSGYLKTKSGRELIFSSLNNNFQHKSYLMRKEISEVLWYIYQYF